eukprot:TRINITY_DN18086_c0_g1_i1.p1 TRINITY_DN18086_c0_g1~~TRINITY_DN18086_c0_g1_i1.p1  ORF type:complete len:525 (-),score=76.07 TRINITY_DN18086_c0_g1_i1:201-1775(-)
MGGGASSSLNETIIAATDSELSAALKGVPQDSLEKLQIALRQAADTPSYRLTYANSPGMAEPIRMAFALSESPLTDNRFPPAELTKKRPDSAWGLFPTLEVTQNGSTIVLGGAFSVVQKLLAYLGKLLSYGGKPLYPRDPMEAYLCDEILAMAEEARGHIAPTLTMKDKTEQQAARRALIENGGVVYATFEKINARIAGRAFSAGDTVTVADLQLVNACNVYESPLYDGFLPDGLAPFEHIVKLRQKVVSLPPLVEYYKDTDEKRAKFKPGPGAASDSDSSVSPPVPGKVAVEQGSMDAPSYRLTYFTVPGIAEPIRMVFALSETPFTDNRLPPPELMKNKPDSAWGLFPTLEVTQNGSTIVLGGAYSVAQKLLAYLGKLLSYGGKPLYPRDPMEAYLCDEILAMAEEARGHIAPTLTMKDKTEQQAARRALIENGGVVYATFEKINARIAGRAFSAGDTVTVADLQLVNACNVYESPLFDGFLPDGLAPFEHIVKLRQKVVSLPPLVEYYKDTDEKRAKFKPH